MPSHKIHIKLAQDINKTLKLDNDSIMLGSVLPDLTIDKNHGLSHFQYKDEYPYNLASSDEFVKKYPNMKDPISIGYITHLLTDRFYNDYLYKNFSLKGVIINKEFKNKIYSPFEDYLLNNRYVDKFNSYDAINKIPNYDNINFDKDYLKQYITDFNNDIDKETNFNGQNINLASIIYNGCLKYILDEIKKYL